MSYVRKSDIRVKSYNHSNILSASVVQFRSSRYIMSPNSDIRVKSYDHLNFSRASVVQFRESRWVMSANQTLFVKLWPFEFLECFCCAISSVSIYYVPNSDIRVKIYDHWNFSRASVVQFRESRWVMSANQTSVWKVMTVRISWVLPLCNFERLDILCPKLGHPCEKLWPFEFLESFRRSISSV